jgi:hypothetical protein
VAAREQGIVLDFCSAGPAQRAELLAAKQVRAGLIAVQVGVGAALAACLPPVVQPYQFRGPLGDGVDRGVGVAGDNGWHYGRVGDPQPADAVHKTDAVA